MFYNWKIKSSKFFLKLLRGQSWSCLPFFGNFSYLQFLFVLEMMHNIIVLVIPSFDQNKPPQYHWSIKSVLRKSNLVCSNYPCFSVGLIFRKSKKRFLQGYFCSSYYNYKLHDKTYYSSKRTSAVDAIRLTGWVKLGEIWQLNFNFASITKLCKN